MMSRPEGHHNPPSYHPQQRGCRRPPPSIPWVNHDQQHHFWQRPPPRFPVATGGVFPGPPNNGRPRWPEPRFHRGIGHPWPQPQSHHFVFRTSLPPHPPFQVGVPPLPPPPPLGSSHRGNGRPFHHAQYFRRGGGRSGMRGRGRYGLHANGGSEDHPGRTRSIPQLETREESQHMKQDTGEMDRESSADNEDSNVPDDFETERRQSIDSSNQLDTWQAKISSKTDDDVTHRERLTDEMVSGTYECMVCCDFIRPAHEIWSCQNCYHLFHLRCIKKWAKSPTSSVDGLGWRCPGCQNVTSSVPKYYLCFCGKIKNPEWNRYDIPHSCGDHCGRKRPQETCIHSCNLLCHPGPCPPCGIYVSKECFCGQESKPSKCGQNNTFSCGQPCKQLLDCGKHTCPLNCHKKPCSPCDQVVQRTCFCGSETREEKCTQDTTDQPQFTCEKKCERTLACETHTCQLLCHAGPCQECPLSPSLVNTCPCGQTDLKDLLPSDQVRKKCTDDIPVCDKICGKVLKCGSKDVPHRCQSLCHAGPCLPCPLKSLVRCRCGSQVKELLCEEMLSGESQIFTCGKRCNKKKTCGRHKCLQTCCTITQHTCSLICGRKLSCGRHTCDEPCHLGNCHRCWNTSFDELTCYCGETVLFPPVPCGTKPPECNKPCTRSHSCDHQVFHNCHSERRCPPCTFLTSKWCYGHHVLRTCIPCFQTHVCCGFSCNKPLPCEQHKCVQICHEGPCYGEGFKCTQPCTKPKSNCEHPCGAPCHEGECPKQICKIVVPVTCKCGHRTGTLTCSENEAAFQRLIASVMASKHHATEQGQTLDISQVMKEAGLRKNSTLNCTDECSQIERNRRMALALQITNPELTSKLKPPMYSDFLKDQMKHNSTFVTSVYNKLTELVQSSKQSKQKSRSHAFPPMKSDYRRIIHELAEFFGCETQSYDEEPKRNVVATAIRDKSWLPSTSIMSVVQERAGAERQIRKPPPPVPHHCQRSTTQIAAVVTSDVPKKTENLKVDQNRKSDTSGPPIDYFDYTD